MDQVRALLWLRWRLLVRSYQRYPWRIVALLAAMAWMLSIAGLIAAGSLTAFLRAPGKTPFEVLNVLLFGVWLFWAIAPVLGFSVGGSYDVTRQLSYPIPPLRMFVANVLSTALGPSVLLLVLLLASPVIGFTLGAHTPALRPVAGVLCMLTALLFGLHVIVFGQTTMLVFLGVLRSRRYQDALTVLLPLIVVGAWLVMQYVMRGAHRFNYQKLYEWHPSHYLWFLPSGFAAHAMDSASWGEFGRFALHFALLVAATMAVAVVGSWLMQRIYVGDITDTPAPRRREGERRTEGRGLEGRVSGWLRLPPAFGALALKELRYLWREPQMKSLLISFIFPVVWLLVFVHTSLIQRGPVLVAVVGAMCVFSASTLAMNSLGYDRDGLSMLFLFPTDRRVLLLGKNVLAFLMAVAAGLLGVTVAAAWLREPGTAVALLPFLFAFAIILVAGGNVVSVYFPMRVVRRGENPFGQGMEQGCTTGLIRGLVFNATLVVSLPIVAGYVLPYLLHKPALFPITALVSLVYSVTVYLLVLPHMAAALLQRETQIIEVCTASSDQ